MTSRDFCYWLQGFFELKDGTTNIPLSINPAQAELIRKHLALVFKHEIDPSYGDEQHQAVLNEIHNGKPICGNVEKPEEPKPTTGTSTVPKKDIVYRC